MSDEKVLTKEVAEEFLADTESVDLSEYTMIEDVAAESLSKHDGGLYLNGLTSLSDGPGHIALAESLSKSEGFLNLEGLKKLSDAAAESLSKHEGDLDLDGLGELSDAAAESLSKHAGDLDLDGLTELSDAAAESLSKHAGDLYLNGLRRLSDSPGHIALAVRLSKHKGGRLGLNGLTELSDAAAEGLNRHGGKLIVILSHLPESAAKILRDAGHE